MDVLNWIGKNIAEIKEDFFYKKYFSMIPLEKGIDVYFLFNPLMGIDLILEENYKIKSIHFYSGKTKTASRFSDGLPLNLDFSFSRIKSKQVLGTPGKSGGGGFSFIYGTIPPWDKYFYDKFSLHLQFSEDQNEIELITIDSL